MFRARMLLPLALCLLLSPRVPALEKAPEPLARPVDVMATTSSPRRLAAVLDTLVQAATRNIPEKAAPPFGALGDVIASFNMPSLFDNPDIAMAALVDLGDGKDIAFAVVLDGVEPKRLAADLKAGGFSLTTRGKTLVVDLKPFSPGEELYLLPLGGTRVVAGLSPDMNDKFAAAAAGWRPERSAKRDIAVGADLRRLREVFSDQVQSLRDKLQPGIEAAVLAKLTPDFKEEFCRNVAGTVAALVERVLVLPQQIATAELSLGLDGDLVELALAVVPEKDGSLSRLAAGYADRSAPAYTLTRTVMDNAILLTASSRLGGTLFPEGEFLAGAAGMLAAGAIPDEADAIAALQREIAGNPVEEEVCGYYLRGGRVRRSSISRVADGKAYADSLARSATAANRVLDGVFGSSLKPPRRAFRVQEEKGASGKANYRRLFPVLDPPPTSGEADAMLDYSLYLASNRNLVLTLLGSGLSPEAVPEFIGLLGEKGPKRLVDIPEVRGIFEKVKSSGLGFSLFRPGIALTGFFWLALQSNDMRKMLTGRSAAEAVLSRIPEAVSVAGLAFDAAPGVLEARLVVPLDAIDEMAVVISMVEGARNTDKAGNTEKSDRDDTGGW